MQSSPPWKSNSHSIAYSLQTRVGCHSGGDSFVGESPRTDRGCLALRDAEHLLSQSGEFFHAVVLPALCTFPEQIPDVDHRSLACSRDARQMNTHHAPSSIHLDEDDGLKEPRGEDGLSLEANSDTLVFLPDEDDGLKLLLSLREYLFETMAVKRHMPREGNRTGTDDEMANRAILFSVHTSSFQGTVERNARWRGLTGGRVIRAESRVPHIER